MWFCNWTSSIHRLLCNRVIYVDTRNMLLMKWSPCHGSGHRQLFATRIYRTHTNPSSVGDQMVSRALSQKYFSWDITSCSNNCTEFAQLQPIVCDSIAGAGGDISVIQHLVVAEGSTSRSSRVGKEAWKTRCYSYIHRQIPRKQYLLFLNTLGKLRSGAMLWYNVIVSSPWVVPLQWVHTF